MTAAGWRFVVCDALEKVFADTEPRPLDRRIPLTAFAGQTAAVQVAMRPPAATDYSQVGDVLVSLEGDAAPHATVAAVDLVPCTLVAFEEHDDGWVRDAPGLYPDVLRPLPPDGRVVPLLGSWRAVWISVLAPAGADGPLPLRIVLRSAETGAELFATEVEVTVSSIELPPLDLVHAAWIHPDGLADFYGDEVFDEGHWRAIDRTLAAAAAMRVNAVLTPVWTPPLDTAVGATRRRVQLVQVSVDEHGRYDFDFDLLRRWIGLCRDHGIRYLEIAHLFTQWGAAATPAVWVRGPDGTLRRRFGWDVPATDPSWRRFLEAVIPALRSVLIREWGLDRVLWHISDEPHGAEMLEAYLAARGVVEDLLEGCTIVDALSDHAFYAKGAVPVPIVATDAVEPFLADGPDRLWMYYCVAQHTGVSNRFIGMPSARTRAIGTQLFLHRAGGFLHWGFDFYLTRNSTAPVNPFADTSAGGQFLAGDAFIVYPGADREPWESIRFRAMADAMDDHRAMQALEALAGPEAVRRVVDPCGAISMRSASLDPDHYRAVSAALFAAIVALRSGPTG